MALIDPEGVSSEDRRHLVAEPSLQRRAIEVAMACLHDVRRQVGTEEAEDAEYLKGRRGCGLR